MPRRPRFIHPLRVVRLALGKSQLQFARMFGVSASYIQAVELGQRNLNDELADAIMLRCGVDASSLKRKRGKPEFLSYFNDELAKAILGSDSHVPVNPETWRAVEEFAGLRKVTDERERLRRLFAFWRCVILPALKAHQWRVHAALGGKVALLFEAAERENKYYSVAMQLSRVIDTLVDEYDLLTTINVIGRRPRGTRWPSFMDILSLSFPLKPRRLTR